MCSKNRPSELEQKLKKAFILLNSARNPPRKAAEAAEAVEAESAELLIFSI